MPGREGTLATGLVIGSIVGTGVFVMPALLAAGGGESEIQEEHVIKAVQSLVPLAIGNDLVITLAASQGGQVRQDGARWRRVVPSPEPARLLDLPAIRLLLDTQTIVICSGGGGSPVALDGTAMLRGVDAVVDKNLTPVLLARELDADALLLIDVEAVPMATAPLASRGPPAPRVSAGAGETGLGAHRARS